MDLCHVTIDTSLKWMKDKKQKQKTKKKQVLNILF